MSQEHSHPGLADTGVVTAGFTMQAGWSNNGSSFRRVGPWVELDIWVLRTGATITGGAAGNIADSDLVQIPALAQPQTLQVVAYDTAGVAFGSGVVDTAGMVTIKTLHATATIAAGNGVLISATYLAG